MDALDDEDYRLALRLGLRLKRRRHSSAFEILARAYRGLDREDRAITILEKGVELAPDVGMLWHQLGCYYSDNERYEDAHRAFTQSRMAHDGQDALADLNEVLVYLREDKPKSALQLLDSIPGHDDEVTPHMIASVRIDVLMGLGRLEDAVKLCDDLLAHLEGFEDGDTTSTGLGPDVVTPADRRGNTLLDRAEARWRLGVPTDTVLEDVWRSMEQCAADERALRLLRDVRDLRSVDSRYYRILVEGELLGADEDEPDTVYGFFANYEVIADSLDEAMQFITEMEPSVSRDSLRMEESEDLEPRPNQPKGVVDRSGHAVYPLEDES